MNQTEYSNALMQMLPHQSIPLMPTLTQAALGQLLDNNLTKSLGANGSLTPVFLASA